MQVYLAPRQSPEDPVYVTGLTVMPEDARIVCAALQEAHTSAATKREALAWYVPSANLMSAYIYAPEDRAGAEREYRAYADKALQYHMAMSEIRTAREPHHFNEASSLRASMIHAGMIHAGIMFGLAGLGRKGHYDSEKLRQAEQQIAYTEAPLRYVPPIAPRF